MRSSTHMTAGFLFALVSVKWGLLSLFALTPHGFLSFAVIGSLIPDLDHPRSKFSRAFPMLGMPIQAVASHRSIFHSFVGLFVTMGAVYFASQTLQVGSWRTLMYAVGVGFSSHLVMDSLSPMGIHWLRPITKKLHLRGPIHSGGFLEKILHFTLLFVTVVLVYDFGWAVIGFI